MTRYKQAEFEDEDSSSIGSVALNSEGISTSATHIRYHTVRIYIYMHIYNIQLIKYFTKVIVTKL